MKEINEPIKLVYQELVSKYRKQSIDKKELSIELGISVSCINYRLSMNSGLPCYNKSKGKCGRITFSIVNVAHFLVENNIKTVNFF